jgi:hypothetical protein
VFKPMKSDADDAKLLMPLLMRCPCLPGNFIPDGKQTTTLPGGGVVTVWWKNGKPHRDPQAGCRRIGSSARPAGLSIWTLFRRNAQATIGWVTGCE